MSAELLPRDTGDLVSSQGTIYLAEGMAFGQMVIGSGRSSQSTIHQSSRRAHEGYTERASTQVHWR